MPHPSRFAQKLAGGLSAAALTGLLVGAAARQTPPKTAPGTKPPIPSPSDPRPRQPAPPPPAAKTGPPPAANTNTPALPNILPPKPPEDYVYLDLHNLKSNEKTGISTGTDFKYTEKDTVITGDKARYDRRNEILDTESNLVLDDPKHHATGDKAHIERNKHLAIITGNVIIVLKPETAPPDPNAAPNPDKDRQNAQDEKKRGGTITCDRVEDFYQRKFSVLNGHLVFKQRFVNDKGETVERTMTADHAEYDGKKDLLHLFGPVDFQDSEGQEMHTKEDVIVGTKEGEETTEYKGPVIIKTKAIKDDNGDNNGKPPANPGKPK